MTPEEQEQQDKVDGAIFDLIQELYPNMIYSTNPACQVIPDWDIEKIGAIRDVLIQMYPEIKYP